MDPVERDYQTYRCLLDLWSDENPIKTTKLQFLLVVNAGLLLGAQLGGGMARANLPLFLAGAVLCLVWTLSIGRTVLSQKAWQRKLVALADNHPDDPRFQILDTREAERQAPGWLRVLGGVSSKYYLLAAPVAFGLAWMVAAVAVSAR